MSDVATLVQADPESLDLMARRLLRLASAAAEQAELAGCASAGTWHGEAADTFEATAVHVTTAVRRATDTWEIAAAVIREFASRLRELQGEARHAGRLLEEADALTTAWLSDPSSPWRSDPGAELRSQAHALLQRATAEFDASAARVAAVLVDLLPPPAPRAVPAPSRIGSFAIGLVEGTAGLASVLEMANPASYVLHPAQLWRRPQAQLRVVERAFTDPISVGKELIDWETWRSDPWRAGGRLVPLAVLTASTDGAGLAARAAAPVRLDVPMAGLGGPGIDAFIPPSLRTGGHGLRDINAAPGGPHFDNCPSCAIAVDQTFAGAAASAIPGRALTVKDLAARYDGMFVMADRDWIIEQLESAPSGARGIVFGMRDGREGHVFNALQENGRVYFVDGQTGAPAVFQDSYVSLFFLRTDRLSPLGAIAKEPS
jgi:hypothetical protein